MSRLGYISAIALLAGTLLGNFTASAQRTTRRGIRAKTPPAAQVSATAVDTIMHPADSLVILSGYDKPLRSRKETFFVTNHTRQSISAIDITLEYLDSSNRQLHNRTLCIPVQIPAGETRKIDIPAWDTQLSFYYIKSAPARATTRCYPYDVKCSINFILCPICSDI